ncbi:TlpA family protein disulfide reductase [bacterium]|nr:TlpA family protein disulfide reductase [bacterium]
MKKSPTLILLFVLVCIPVLSQSPLSRAYALLDEAKYEPALAIVDSLIKAEGVTRRNMQARYYIYDAMGDLKNALEAALSAETVNEKKSPWDCMAIVDTYIKMDDRDQAMKWLNLAVERGFKSITTLADSLYDPVRNEEFFINAIKTIQINTGIGQPAKDIQVSMLDGTPFQLSAQTGKVVIVDFFATWCGPCRAEMPNLKNLYTDYHGKGMEIIGISLDSDRDKLTDYIKKEDLPWKFAFTGKAWDDPDAIRYGVNSIPSIWIVDKKGILRQFDVRGEDLRALVKLLLDET